MSEGTTSSHPSGEQRRTPNGLVDKFKFDPMLKCTREATMWGIGTGLAMGLHRLRMGSRPTTIGNAAFATGAIVLGSSFYFCQQNVLHNQTMVEQMMSANDFEHTSKAPTQPKVDDHPFLKKAVKGKELEKTYETYHDVEKYPKNDDNSKAQ